MFREMRRKNQQLPEAECIRLLKELPRGVLSLMGDGGYPYGIPIDHYYNPEDGKLYFHGGKHGHKIDAIRSCSKASFCVMDEGCRTPDSWGLYIRSVIVFGQVEILEDAARAVEIARHLSYKYTSDRDFIEQEIQQSQKNLLVFSLTPEHITGKLVNES